jgi:hypothetical protein
MQIIHVRVAIVKVMTTELCRVDGFVRTSLNLPCRTWGLNQLISFRIDPIQVFDGVTIVDPMVLLRGSVRQNSCERESQIPKNMLLRVPAIAYNKQRH